MVVKGDMFLIILEIKGMVHFFCYIFADESVYLQDFESERKWKLAQARKVALKASKGMVDHATREEKKSKVIF